MKSFVILLSILFLNSISGTDREEVTIIAGKQIQIGETIIELNNTSVDEILKAFELKDIFGTSYSHWDGVDMETGESTYEYEYVKNILYKEIDFEFKGQTKDSLTLEWIRINKADYLVVKVNDQISVGDTNPPIDKYFKEQNKYDYISNDSLTYNLYSQGISFQLERKENDRILKEVSVHYKIEEK